MSLFFMILYSKIETNLIITWIIVSELMRLQLSLHKCVAAKLINFGFRTSRKNIKLNCPVVFWYTALHIAVHTILCSEVTDKESPAQKEKLNGSVSLKRKQRHEFQTLKSGKPFEVSVMVQCHCLLIKICFRCPPPPLSSPLIEALNQRCPNWKDCRLKKSLDVFEFSKFVPWLWNLCS